jgi:regulator of sigma E protease
VFVHEYGHFLAAKQIGVKVTTFSLGIGPEIFGVEDKHGTRWCFSWLPIGGYVMMLGDGDVASVTEDDESLENLSEEEKKQSFLMKSNWEKMWVAFCGPLFNYIYAFVVMAGMSFFYGVPTYEPIIGEVAKDSPAEKAGIRPGDRIISVDDHVVEKYREVVLQIADNELGQVSFLVERDGAQQKILIIPQIKETKRILGGIKKTKMVGIRPSDPVFVKKPFLGSLELALHECIYSTREMCSMFTKLFAGKKSIDDFGGIVRMAEVAGDLSKKGNFALLILFTVTLSLNLGFINLFPLPVLDGGKILISFLEEVTRKKLNKKLQEYIMIACAVLLIFLMLITTVNDILHIKMVNKFVSSIIG